MKYTDTSTQIERQKLKIAPYNILMEKLTLGKNTKALVNIIAKRFFTYQEKEA